MALASAPKRVSSGLDTTVMADGALDPDVRDGSCRDAKSMSHLIVVVQLDNRKLAECKSWQEIGLLL